MGLYNPRNGWEHHESVIKYGSEWYERVTPFLSDGFCRQPVRYDLLSRSIGSTRLAEEAFHLHDLVKRYERPHCKVFEEKSVIHEVGPFMPHDDLAPSVYHNEQCQHSANANE